MSGRYLLDTHIILAILREDVYERFPWLAKLVSASNFAGVVSVASLWEIAIKTRLGKLDVGVPLDRMQSSLQAEGLMILRSKSHTS